MVNLPFVGNTAPAGVRRPTVSIRVGQSSSAGLVTNLAAGLLADDFWASHQLSLALDLGTAPFVDCGRLSYAVGADAPDVGLGDTLSISLGYGDSSLVSVFTGTITRHHHTATGYKTLYASGAGYDLSHLRLNQRYEQQTAGDIVSDLASQVGVPMGTVEPGISLPFYNMLGHTPAYQLIAQLAKDSGHWAYVTATGELIFATASLGQSVQTFTYGVDILDVALEETTPSMDALVVTGEGAAGSQGQAAGNWLVADSSGVRSQAGSGSHGRYLSDGALRSQAAVQSVAASRVAAAVSPLGGRLWLAGAPAVTVGSTVTLAQLPDASLNGDFLVRQVGHRLTKAGGFVTQLHILKPGETNLLSGALATSLGGLL